MEVVADAERNYAAFISYSHVDEAAAAWLHRTLEAYRTPRAVVGRAGRFGPVRARIGLIFRDREELGSPSELGARIEQALLSAEALVVVCSAAAARSPWVRREIAFYKTHRPSAQILALVADGTPAGESASFLRALLNPTDPSTPTDRLLGVEPLVSNLKVQGRSITSLKIIAELLGVDYDVLFQRERRRNRLRLVGAAGAATGIMGALSVALVFALLNGREAKRERQIAEINERQAVANAIAAATQTKIARAAALEATRQRNIATERAAEAHRQQQLAEMRQIEARRQQQLAETRQIEAQSRAVQVLAAQTVQDIDLGRSADATRLLKEGLVSSTAVSLSQDAMAALHHAAADYYLHAIPIKLPVRLEQTHETSTALNIIAAWPKQDSSKIMLWTLGGVYLGQLHRDGAKLDAFSFAPDRGSIFTFSDADHTIY